MRNVYLQCVVFLVVLGMALPLGATSILPLDLEDLCNRSDSIVLGTVLSAEPQTMQFGSSTLDTVQYRVKVEESFKGAVTIKDGVSVAELTMLGNLKSLPVNGSVTRISSVPGLPQLQVGQRYLLFTTPPSPVGLSTTVGLGTGCFEVSGEGDKAVVLNEFNNAGVFQGLPGMPSSGPVTYSAVADQLHEILGH